MGLDSVELVLEVEEKFGIRIKDEDATKIITVGDLYKLVLRELNKLYGSADCPAQRMFYMLRKTITQELALPRSAVRPSAQLDVLFPKIKRHSSWKKVRDTNFFILPYLSRPMWLTGLGWTSGLGLVVYLLILNPFGFKDRTLLLKSFALGIALLIVFFNCTRPFKLYFPKNCSILGDFVKRTVPGNIGSSKTANSEVIWNKLVEIICEQLGVKKEDVQYNSHFVRDFNCD